MSDHPPVYIRTRKTGNLKQKIKAAYKILNSCTLCPRSCQVNRTKGEKGVCRAGSSLEISSFSPHFGEEPPLSGTRGSGTIFFTHCNLRCCFCQNYDISIQGRGETAEPDQLAAIMLHLKARGCHNINFVTPVHMLPFILEGLDIAAENGLDLPLVYNSSGYESVETLKLLKGVMDIYMPDFKFWDPVISEKACDAPDYPDIARKAIKEMFDQTGDLKTDQKGIAVSGLLVRHLVLPHDLAGTQKVMEFLSKKISPDTHVNIMSQYRPMWQAHKIPELSSPVTVEEFRTALETAKGLGLNIIR